MNLYCIRTPTPTRTLMGTTIMSILRLMQVHCPENIRTRTSTNRRSTAMHISPMFITAINIELLGA